MIKKISKWFFLFLSILFGVISCCFFFSKFYILGLFFFIGYFGCFEAFEALKRLIAYDKNITIDKRPKL